MPVPANSPAAKPARGPPGVRQYVSLVVALLFLAGGFVVRLSVDNPADSVLAIYVLPIALVAVEWGPLAGLVIAGASFGLFAGWIEIADVNVDTFGYVLRACVYFPVALLVGVGAQRLREAGYREAEFRHRHRAILETSHEAFVAMDRDGLITDWNPAAERTFGWPAEDALGRPLADTVVPPRMREGFLRGLHRFLDTGEGPMLGRRVEILAMRRDGSELPIELSLAVSNDGGGSLVHGFMHDISEREEGQRRLQRAARYFEISHDLIATLTEDLHLHDVNDRWQAVLGWTPEELRSQSVLELIHPDDREATIREVVNGAQSGLRAGFRNRLRAKDKKWHWIEWSAVAVPEEKIAYAAGRDVTERTEAEAERRLLGAIVESSRDAIYGFTLDGSITSWNETAERLFGYDPAEAIGMSIAELVPPDLPDDTAMILERIPRGEVIEDRRTARIGKAGRHLDLSLTMSPVRDENRDVVGGSTIARDISDRKRSGRYMGAQHRVTAMLAHAPPIAEIGAAVLPMLAGSGDWTCALYWGAAEDRDELRCEASWTAPRLRGPILPVHEGTTCELQPNGNATPDGEAVWVIDVAGDSPIPLGGRLAAAGMATAVWTPLVADGRLWGGFALLARESREPDEELLGVLSAIASQIDNYVERRYAEQRSDRVKNEFFSLISHELRTPLTSIIGYTELIGETESDSLSDQGKDFLKVVRRNAGRELRLVGDILLLTQIEAGTFRLVPEQADLKEIVDDSVSSARLIAERQSVSLSSQTEPVPGLWGDSSRLGQVVDNLLTNAIKFSPDGGEVVVKLGRRNGHALIEVSDTGMGIPPKDARRLFERLYRASGATDLHIPGTGLGLTIVKAIVDAHGGTIDAQSSEGCGTTFSVGLPIGAGEPHDKNEQST